MSAGTLTLTNNSDAVTGSGTAFTTDLTAGDFVVSVVGGVTYSLPVKTVTSNTALVLATPYQGPTQTKLAWSAVPFNTMNRVTAGMVTQATEALRGLNLDKQNWQSVFSAPGNITVELPDGSKYTGPSWLSVASQAGNLSALGIGGTGISLTALDWQTFDFVPGAKFNVSSLNITNTPPGLTIPSGSYGVLINVTGYEGNNRHVEVWISTTTAANYYHYEIRVTNNNQPGQRAFTVRQIWTSADTIPLSNLALNDIGLNYTGMPTIANVDWQTVPLASGMIQIWNCSNWTNAPAGLPTTSLVSINVTAKAGRAIVEVSALNAGATRQSWTVEIEDANNLGSRRFAVQIDLTFSDDDSGKALARSRLGFADLGFGVAGQPVTTNFNWQTALMASGQSWLLDASNMVNAPTDLPNSGRLVVVAAGMSSNYVMLDIYEQPLSGAATGRRWYVYIGTYQTAGSRTFTVRPLLTKADLDSRVGYALLAPSDNMTKGQRLVLANPFGNNTPVTVRAELLLGSVWVNTGWLYHPNYGGYGTNASYSEGEGIIVQGGSFLLNTNAGNAGGSSGTSTLELTTGKVRVHVFKVTS